MNNIKVSIQELRTIQQIAKQQECSTGQKIPVKNYYEGHTLMCEAPSEFLQSLGF